MITKKRFKLEKPDNILVDYNDTNGCITDFDFVVGDWGTAGINKYHFGGTPMYASPHTFHESEVKDFFAFGRIATELYFEKPGKTMNKKLNRSQYSFCFIFDLSMAGNLVFPD